MNRNLQVESYLHEATNQLRERLTLHFVLCDPRIREVAKFWDLYLGRHENLVRSRMEELKIPCTERFISELLSCLEVASARVMHGRGGGYSNWAERSVFEGYSRDSENLELRCQCCGYWFIESDLSDSRKRTAFDLGLTLAPHVDPRRESDQLKPLSIEFKDRVLTRLEIDHVRPVAGLGTNDPENLRILCRFCNEGKSHYLLPIENISIITANSLIFSYPVAGAGRLIIPAIYAAMANSNGRCGRCGDSISSTEVTCKFSINLDTESSLLIPPLLEVVCYDCLFASRECPLNE